ncbi:MAG TPA: hypothetical protein PLU71_03220 [Candidatus Dependentiae bacterium]|nr:hypothetical protein [Candidatus Dependentiae bacterium]HRQ62842.1 hypothetical protein [Candidatus Dependentiae bacterium]
MQRILFLIPWLTTACISMHAMAPDDFTKKENYQIVQESRDLDIEVDQQGKLLDQRENLMGLSKHFPISLTQDMVDRLNRLTKIFDLAEVHHFYINSQSDELVDEANSQENWSSQANDACSDDERDESNEGSTSSNMDVCNKSVKIIMINDTQIYKIYGRAMGIALALVLAGIYL